MSCPDIARALAEGRILSQAERRHMQSCAECGEVVERHRRYREALRNSGAHEPVPAADFSARVLEELPATPDPFEVVAWAAWRSLPLAAALALVLGLWTALLPPPDRADVGPLTAQEVTLIWLLTEEAP